MTKGRGKARTFSHFLPLLFFGCLSRFLLLSRESLWLDETQSLLLAGRSLSLHVRDLFFFSQWTDAHPFFYHFILKLWTVLFGVSELALRSLSATFGVLLIVATYWVGKKLISEKVGFVAAILVLLNPVALHYAQEARMYSLVSFLILLSTYLFFSLLTGPTKITFIAYVLCSATLIYSDYLGFLLLFGQLVFFLIWLHQTSDLRSTKTVVWAYLMILVLYIPWLPNTLGIQKWDMISWMAPPTLVQGIVVFLDALGVTAWPYRALGSFGSPGAVILGAAGGIVGGSALILGFRSALRDRSSFQFLMAVLGLIPLLIFLLSMWVVPIFNLRQIFVYFPFFALLMASGVLSVLAGRNDDEAARGPGRVFKFAFLAFLVLNLAGSVRAYHTDTKEEWRQIAKDLEEVQSNIPVFVSEWYMIDPLQY